MKHMHPTHRAATWRALGLGRKPVRGSWGGAQAVRIRVDLAHKIRVVRPHPRSSTQRGKLDESLPQLLRRELAILQEVGWAW